MVLIIVGVALLLEKNGIVDRQLISHWWPLLLVLAGGCIIATRLNR